MQELNWFRNATFLSRPGSAPGLTQKAAAPPANFQADESCPDPSDSTPDISFKEIEGEIAEQFRLREILEEVCLVTGATGAAIALARGKEMVCCANAGADAPDLGVCLDLHRGLSGNCIQTRQLQQCADTETDPRVDRQVCRQRGVRSLAVLPLLQGSELLGVFEVLSSRPNAFGQNELDSLLDLGNRISSAHAAGGRSHRQDAVRACGQCQRGRAAQQESCRQAFTPTARTREPPHLDHSPWHPGDCRGPLVGHGRGLAIRVAESNPSNSQWHRDASIKCPI